MKKWLLNFIKWFLIVFIAGGVIFKFFIFGYAFDFFWQQFAPNIHDINNQTILMANISSTMLSIFFTIWAAVSFIVGAILALIYQKPIFKMIL